MTENNKKHYVQGEMYADADSPDRYLDADEARTLKAGANHYRAYVGPPNRFDFMAGTQFSLLFHLGIRDDQKVLDFGCGSLRLGRLLIPFLQKGNYYGIDPNKWLIQDGLANELGKDAGKIKAPMFSHNDDFDCTVFGEQFDFNIAQSIVTHTGRDLFLTYLRSAAAALKPDGIIMFSYIRSEDPNNELPLDGWHYPQCVGYTDSQVHEMLGASGLIGKPIPWYHPGAAWFCAALSPDSLPADEMLHHLSGAVFRQPQFVKSLTEDGR